MKLLHGLKKETIPQHCVATIGNFDGVHLGHQALIKALCQQAKHLNLPVSVFLFEPHAREYFNAEEAPARLSSLREKVLALRQCGVDTVYCLTFDKKLASMSPAEFAAFIFTHVSIRYLMIGNDFRFGAQRQGDSALLKMLGQQHDCDVHVFEEFLHDNERVSSTEIRKALKGGHLERAHTLLGRTYSICGRVIQGNGIGRTWGIPTANINLRRKQLALSGVFLVKVMLQDQSIVYGVANLGNRPTIDGSKPVLEVHLFDFDQSIYGEWLHLFFLHKLRNEVKFPSVEHLIAQIRDDITQAKAILKF